VSHNAGNTSGIGKQASTSHEPHLSSNTRLGHVI
jgi:hypothetical protein